MAILEKAEIEELNRILLKKARGYMTTEVVTEYAERDSEVKEIKRKETVKEVPPDLSAIKLLLEEDDESDNLSIEELKEERARLIELLLKEERIKKTKNKFKEDNV